MSKKCNGHGYHPVPVRGPMMRSQLAMPRNSHAAAVAAPHAAGFDAGEKLLGRRVLVVEDEALVAMDLLFSLEDAGAKVLGPAMSLSAALALAELAADIDCAVLDVDIAGQDVYPVARVLQRRGDTLYLSYRSWFAPGALRNVSRRDHVPEADAARAADRVARGAIATASTVTARDTLYTSARNWARLRRLRWSAHSPDRWRSRRCRRNFGEHRRAG